MSSLDHYEKILKDTLNEKYELKVKLKELETDLVKIDQDLENKKKRNGQIRST